MPIKGTRQKITLFFLATLVGLSVASVAKDAWVGDDWTAPLPGTRRLHRATANQNINALFVDLCAAGISVRATAWEERGKTVSGFAAATGVQAAINGDFFESDYTTVGLAMHGGAAWPCGMDNPGTSPAGFGSYRAVIHHQSDDSGAEPWMAEMVAGQTTLVWDGVIAAGPGGEIHPRTALGLSRDRRTLIMVVVDGRHAPSRTGVTLAELAGLLLELGAYSAVNLDGGKL